MKTYRVRWEIDIEAKNPRDAAKQALKIQRDSQSIATFFEVSTMPERVDLGTGRNELEEIVKELKIFKKTRDMLINTLDKKKDSK